MRAAIGLWMLGAAVARRPGGRQPSTQPRAEPGVAEVPGGARRARPRKAAIDPLAAAGVDLQQALARLKAGRSYAGPTGGRVDVPVHRDRRHPARDRDRRAGRVPSGQAMARAHPAARRRQPPRVSRGRGPSRPIASRAKRRIYLYPRGHARAEWWHLNQYRAHGGAARLGEALLQRRREPRLHRPASPTARPATTSSR